MTIELLANIVGLAGTSLVVLTYLLVQLDRLDAKSFAYSFYNLLGAVLLLLSLLVHFNLASFLIEIFWILASLIGLWQWWRKRRFKRSL